MLSGQSMSLEPMQPEQIRISWPRWSRIGEKPTSMKPSNAFSGSAQSTLEHSTDIQVNYAIKEHPLPLPVDLVQHTKVITDKGTIIRQTHSPR